MHYNDLDVNLITAGPWPKPSKTPTKNHLVDLIYNKHQVEVQITTPECEIGKEPEKNAQTKGWMISGCLPHYHVPGEVAQVEFEKKIKEVEEIGMKYAPGLIENLGVPADTPIELGPCIYIGENVRYHPSFRLFLEYERDNDGNPIYTQFRGGKKNPLFVEFGTDKTANVTPTNIKEVVKDGCKCQMVLRIRGWTFTLQKEDKSKGKELAVIIRLKICPTVIGISAPEPEVEWNCDFGKLEREQAAKAAESNDQPIETPKADSIKHETDGLPPKVSNNNSNKRGLEEGKTTFLILFTKTHYLQ